MLNYFTVLFIYCTNNHIDFCWNMMLQMIFLTKFMMCIKKTRSKPGVQLDCPLSVASVLLSVLTYTLFNTAEFPINLFSFTFFLFLLSDNGKDMKQ